MADILVVNGIRIYKYSSAKVKGILGFAEDDKTLSIMCSDDASDEECIKYVYDNFYNMLFRNKRKVIKKEKITSAHKNKLHEWQKPLVADSNTYDPKKDPSNPFSSALPKAEVPQRNTKLTNKELEILVRHHRGYHIHYKFVCNLCRNTHMLGCEYTDDKGHRYVVCNICRGELLKFKGWIHEISANLGHGRK